mgnify:CR=1 FL=1
MGNYWVLCLIQHRDSEYQISPSGHCLWEACSLPAMRTKEFTYCIYQFNRRLYQTILQSTLFIWVVDSGIA